MGTHTTLKELNVNNYKRILWTENENLHNSERVEQQYI